MTPELSTTGSVSRTTGVAASLDSESLERPEAIRQQIDESRASLAEKLGALQGRVAESVQAATNTVTEATNAVTSTVSQAKASVAETVHNVNSAVHDTVETMRDAIDISSQVRRHPWGALAASVAVGFLGERLFGARPAYRHMARLMAGRTPTPFGFSAPAAPPGIPVDGGSSHLQTSQVPGWAAYLRENFGPEIDRLQGLAIGASMALVRDLLSDAVPPAMKSQVHTALDGLTDRMGGSRIQGRVLTPRAPEQGRVDLSTNDDQPTTRWSPAHESPMEPV